jgi:hypothetical protein
MSEISYNNAPVCGSYENTGLERLSFVEILDGSQSTFDRI